MKNFPLPHGGDILSTYPDTTGIQFAGEGDISLPVGGRISTGVCKALGRFVIVNCTQLGVAFRFYGLDEVTVEDGKYSKKNQKLGSASDGLFYDIVRLQELKERKLRVTAAPEFDPKLYVNPASMHISLI